MGAGDVPPERSVWHHDVNVGVEDGSSQRYVASLVSEPRWQSADRARHRDHRSPEADHAVLLNTSPIAAYIIGSFDFEVGKASALSGWA